MKIEIKNDGGYRAFLSFMDKIKKREMELEKREMEFINGGDLYKWKLSSCYQNEYGQDLRDFMTINGLKFRIYLDNRFRVKGDSNIELDGEINREEDFLDDYAWMNYNYEIEQDKKRDGKYLKQREFRPYYVPTSHVGINSEEGDEINIFSLYIEKEMNFSLNDVIKTGDYEGALCCSPQILYVRKFDINKTKGLYDEENINYCTRWIYHFSRKTFLAVFKWIVYYSLVWFLSLSMINFSFTLFKELGFLSIFPYLSFISSFMFFRTGVRYKRRRRAIKMLIIKKKLIDFISLNIKPKIKKVERISYDDDFFDENYEEKIRNLETMVEDKTLDSIILENTFRFFSP